MVSEVPKEVVIGSLRKQLQEANSKISAMKQEIALLNNEIDRLKRIIGDRGNNGHI